MKRSRLVFLMLLSAMCASITTGIVMSRMQEQTTRREPQFDNDHVKVWKSIVYPNQPLNMHRHENGRALIALTDGVLSVVNEAGEPTNTYRWEAGKAYWLDADPPGEVHGDVNEGSLPVEVIVVELQP